MKSVRTNDYVDRDEDTQTSYSRESLRLLKFLFNNWKNECSFKQIIFSRIELMINSFMMNQLENMLWRIGLNLTFGTWKEL